MKVSGFSVSRVWLCQSLPLAAWVAFLALLSQASAQVVFITNWNKTNNIYTNLNMEYPASGVGVPGSGVGTPNASFLYDPATYTSPNAVPGSNYATNTVTFTIASNASGRDFAEINGGQSLVVPVGLNVTSVHLLMSAYNGTAVDIAMSGTGGATEVFPSVFLPDFNGGGVVNQSWTVNGSLTPNLFEQTVFRVNNVGAGGSGNSSSGSFNTYNLVEVSLVLGPQFSAQQLSSITLTSQGYMTLLLGVSVMSVPEPGTSALFLVGLSAMAAGFARRRRSQGARRQTA